MKVPIWLFIVWTICVVGVVIGFGKSADAYTIQGHNIWMWVGIACAAISAAGFIWLKSKSSDK